LVSIKKWLYENNETEWISYDDDNFTTSDRLRVVNFDNGISYDDFLYGYYRLIGKPFVTSFHIFEK
jgi:hypothetical protein